MANAGVLRSGARYGQRNLLLHNAGGRFVETKDAGPGFTPELVSRTLAAGDIDNDGDLDLLITNNGGPANLLLNEGGSAAGNALIVSAIGAGKSNRSAIGARLVVTSGQRRQLREIQSGSSYLGQNDLRAHFGLGQALRADRLEIRWPDGATETLLNVATNQIIMVEECKGIVKRTPFAR
jgi:hypothetical protein